MTTRPRAARRARHGAGHMNYWKLFTSRLVQDHRWVLLALPECVVELCAPFLGDPAPVVNATDSAGSYDVRALTRAIEQDVDTALVAVAGGDFDGVTCKLATSRTEVDQRSRSAIRAHTRRTAAAETRQPTARGHPMTPLETLGACPERPSSAAPLGRGGRRSLDLKRSGSAFHLDPPTPREPRSGRWRGPSSSPRPSPGGGGNGRGCSSTLRRGLVMRQRARRRTAHRLCGRTGGVGMVVPRIGLARER